MPFSVVQFAILFAICFLASTSLQLNLSYYGYVVLLHCCNEPLHWLSFHGSRTIREISFLDQDFLDLFTIIYFLNLFVVSFLIFL